MPRYFFHVQDGLNIPDEEGTDFPDLPSAKGHAVVYAGELILSMGAEFWGHDDWRMTVQDENGLTLFCLFFAGFDAAAIK